MRCLYVDLDGTLLGRNGSIVRDGEGNFSAMAIRALEACFRADVEVVLFSGRREAQVNEDARLIGSTAYIYEVGCGLVIDGERELLTGDLVPGERTIHDQMANQGAPALLLERYGNRLEYHAPWHLNREISHLFRGNVETFEVNEVLKEAGLGHLRLVDNGALHRRESPTLPGVSGLHAYHLIPAEASKARAVARHMQVRGYTADDCIAVGDSREDMDAAEVVGTFWLVANALGRDPSLNETVAGKSNVRVAEESHGAGVYEAVVTTLAQRG